jgi:hypothetical protein
MTTRGYSNALPKFPDDDLMTMADVEAMTERLGLVIITDGRSVEYARPGEQRPGWRRFAMVQKSRPLAPTEPQ